MINPKSAYIIIPVHNRKAVTLRCLNTLANNGDLDRFHVVVVDDGSTDGTTSAIHDQYPEITVLHGDGNLWWTGAICKGMEYAYSQGAKYLIWLNDDTLPAPHTIHYLITACSDQTIVSAQCYDTSEYVIPTYGGRLKKRLSLQFLSADLETTIEADILSGNLVCLPRSVIDSIGYPSHRQTPQLWADVTYTWRARKSGYVLKVIGNARAVCPSNALEEGWSSSSVPMTKRWRMINSPKSSIYPPAYWFYCQTLYGAMGIIPFMQVYLNLVIFTVLRFMLPVAVVRNLKILKDKYMG